MSELYTRWGKALDRERPLPEYPRPQFRRDSYVNLNGVWQYAITDSPETPAAYEGEIVVPFSPEAPLSGVGRRLGRREYLHYFRIFTLPSGFRRARVLLHFEAVDQEAQVSVNGVVVGRHEGGYSAFSFDVTAALREGENELRVTVRDDAYSDEYGTGKQRYRSTGIWYSAQSGIWQTVWLESVPEVYIKSIRITPLYDAAAVRLEAQTQGCPGRLTAAVYAGEEPVAAGEFRDGVCEIPLPGFRSWSPEEPFLYGLRLRADDDAAESYFAMRKFSYTLLDGKRVFALNDKPCFHNGLLDQGYWPDGLLTAPADEALIYDIQTARDMGFNLLRKHIKIESMRWYYHCDRLGMLVWQDMVSGGGAFNSWVTVLAPNIGLVRMKDHDYARFSRSSETSRSRCLRECRETVEQLYNCPCIALWSPFNEGWGQFDALSAARMVRELDPTRYVDHASGWHDQGWEEIKSRHIYFKPVHLRHDGRALCLTEFGGYTMQIPGHIWCNSSFGYKKFSFLQDFQAAYERLYLTQVLPHIRRQRLTAAIYTELSDVEQETNGLLTYDREVLKLPMEKLREINAKMKF